MRALSSIGAAALALAAGGCSFGSEPPASPPPAADPAPAPAAPEPPPPEAAEPAPPLTGREAGWRLVAGRGPNGALAPGELEVTLVVGVRRLGGWTGCNRFGMRGRVVDERLRRRGPLWMTEIGCEPDVQAVEEGYLAALEDATTVERRDGRLVLSGPQTELVFEALPPVDEDALAGRTWTLESFSVGGLANPARARPATLRFDRGGRFEATTGCRDMTGRYVIDAYAIVITRSRMSLVGRSGCSPDAVQQENGIVGVLGTLGVRPEIEGDRLTLESPIGDVLAYRAAP